MTNYKQIWARKKSAESQWVSHFGMIPNTSGIYILTREDENGIKFGYVGQAKHILERLGEHLLGYQHIDLSLKKHKLYHITKNPTGYKLEYITCSIAELDAQERYYIKEYANLGYQLRNKTSGGQDSQKSGLDTGQSTKGYRDGLQQGYKNAINEIKVLFDKYLMATIKEPLNKVKTRKLAEFEEMLKGE